MSDYNKDFVDGWTELTKTQNQLTDALATLNNIKKLESFTPQSECSNGMKTYSAGYNMGILEAVEIVDAYFARHKELEGE